MMEYHPDENTPIGPASLPPEQTDTPSGDFAKEEETISQERSINAFWASVAAVLGLIVLVLLTGRLDSVARDFVRFFGPGDATTESLETGVAEAPASAPGMFTFKELDIHPDITFQPYTAGQLIGAEVSSSTAQMIRQFRDLLDLYEERQGTDDNFTIRVVDNRSNELLELYELESEREAYESLENTENYSWGRIDDMRRVATRNLVQKYASRGVPRNAITVKWGRRNQVLQAREREAPFIEYEIRLARYLGLSLLATEIGTVETFNADKLVSPVGARSRYQMMPYVLRQNDVHHYRISTASGASIEVYEEWHPLLTMEPSFTTLTGYKNAVGHEIPGISAYHTGPGNIYMVYRMFLTGSELFSPSSTVVDAYMWAVTTGYDQVSSGSSFKSYSRGYVASAYGALRATESLPVDSTLTLEAERVQIKPGEQIFLSELLRTLESSDQELDWGPGMDEESHYERFRFMNEHFALPDLQGDGVSPRVDVRLTAESQGIDVKFFLPLGATKVLKDAGLDIIDEEKRFRFTHDTYGRPKPGDVTIWDRQYDNLIRDVANFGFTNENRRRLNFLVGRFRELAESNPSHYRRMQLDIIKTHQRIWQSNVFDKLANAVSAARGSSRFEPMPPSELPTSSRRSR